LIQRPIFRPRSVARPQYRSRLSVVSRSCRFTSPLSHRDARAFLVTVKTQVRTATTMESRAVDVPARNIESAFRSCSAPLNVVTKLLEGRREDYRASYLTQNQTTMSSIICCSSISSHRLHIEHKTQLNVLQYGRSRRCRHGDVFDAIRPSVTPSVCHMPVNGAFYKYGYYITLILKTAVYP